MPIDPRLAALLISGTKSIGKDFYDKVKDKGEDALTDAVLSAVNNKQLKNDLESLLSDEQVYHSNSNTIDSEYYFPDLADYLIKNVTKECEQYIFSVKPEERSACKDDIIRKAIAYAQPDSDEAQKRVVALTTAYLNVIYKYFSSKIDSSQLLLAGKIVSAVKAEQDKQTIEINTHADQDTADLSRQMADEHAETMAVLQELRDVQKSELLTDQNKQEIPGRCLAANRKYFQNKIIPDVLPGIERDDKQYNNSDCLVQLMRDCWKVQEENRHHIILTADGGMGKSSLLLYTATDLLKNAAVLYVPLERLNAENLSMERYICRSLFSEDRNDGKLYELTKNHGSNPALILLLDGFNELNGNGQDKAVKQIKTLISYSGIQLVITSREDFGKRLGLPFTHAELTVLNEERVKSFLTEDEWRHICNDRYHALIELLSVPMMLLMYKQICPLIEKHQESFLPWIDKIQNVTDLIHNWYVSQISALLDRQGLSGEYVAKAYKILVNVLPDVGYLYEREDCLTWSVDHFESFLEGLAKSRFDADSHLKQLMRQYRINEVDLTAFEVEDYLLNDSHLMHEVDGYVSFPHQMYRDYLSAEYIVNNSWNNERIESIWNERSIPQYVAEHIRNMNPSYWEADGVAKNVADYSRNKDDTEYLNNNLVYLFPYTKNSGIPDFSELNLKKCRLRYYPEIYGKESIKLKNAKISLTSLGVSDQKTTLYRCFAFSSDHKWFVAKSRGLIHIWSLTTGIENLVFQDSYDSGKFCFSSDSRYLYYIPGGTNDVWVFSYDEVSLFWQQVAVIHEVLKGSRVVICSENCLIFYYNNRVAGYQLSGGKCAYNKQHKHAYEHPADGEDLSEFFAHRDGSRKDEQFIKNDPDDIVYRSYSDDHHFEARCYIDGTLNIYNNGILQQKLASGIAILKSASVSGNGKRLATLSQRSFNGRRTISLWNLESKCRIKDAACSSDIFSVHLSETGEWIICEKRSENHIDTEWIIMYWDDLSDTFTVEGSFVSNQAHKLTTYGDKVIHKNKDYSLDLFDLRTHEQIPLLNGVGNISLAAFLPDGRIATVDKDRGKLYIRRQDGSIVLEMNTEHLPVIGLSPMKNKPFLTVAMGNGRNYVYHTTNGRLQRGKGDGTRPRSGNKIVVDHPSENVYACSGGLNKFEIWHCWDSSKKSSKGKPISFWYCNQYDGKVTGNVLDMGFNTSNHQLVTVTSNGEIIFSDEMYCNHSERRMIITSISMDQYDFTGVICNEAVKQILIDNGGQ